MQSYMNVTATSGMGDLIFAVSIDHELIPQFWALIGNELAKEVEDIKFDIDYSVDADHYVPNMDLETWVRKAMGDGTAKDPVLDKTLIKDVLGAFLDQHRVDKATSDWAQKKLSRPRQGEDDEDWWKWKVHATKLMLLEMIELNV